MNRRTIQRTLAVLPLLALGAAAATSLPSPATPFRVEEDEVAERYALAAASADADAMEALWTQWPNKALVTFDADLERSLALWEAAPDEPPTDEIAKLHTRALLAARAASAATGDPIFADYASAFVGWTDQQKRDFRQGQKLVAASRKALEEGDGDRAAELAMDGVLRTQQLGDWWGLAMSYAARGRGLQASGSFLNALASYAQARQIYHDLRLTSAEFGNLRRMLNMLVLLEAWPRADVACGDALQLAESAGAESSVVEELQRARATIDAALAGD